MKKEIILLCAALAMAGCSRQVDNGGAPGPETGTGSGSSSSTLSNTIPEITTNNAGGIGNNIGTNSGVIISTNNDVGPATTPKQ